jgi:glycosyltransferase involved in cell wall biosynthesis
MSRPAILYLSYDGMLEPLGQSQVLAYLERLTDRYDIDLVSFEKKGDWADSAARDRVRRRIAAARIGWTPLTYHKAPTAPATAYDIAVGSVFAAGRALRRRTAILHARSYVAGLMALAAKRATGARFLFDMRGLWADERVDAGLWPAGGRLYRLAKRIERRLLEAADHVVTLTHASALEIENFPYLAGKALPISVIPTCADLDRFVPAGPRPPGFTLGFVGAASTWSLFDSVLDFYAALRRRLPEARLRVVNRGEHDFIRSRLAHAGLAEAPVELLAADHSEVPALVGGMTAGAALRKPAYSQIACAPTKLAEYLGCGVPAIVNSGIGDAAGIVERERVGVVLDGFEPDEIERGAEALITLLDDPGLAARCRRTAETLFSLQQGVEAYDRVYRQMLERPA